MIKPIFTKTPISCFKRFAKSYGRSRYGGGDADLNIAIDRLRCSGTESDLTECKSNQWGSSTTCDRNRTAAVNCGTFYHLFYVCQITFQFSVCNAYIKNKLIIVITDIVLITDHIINVWLMTQIESYKAKIKLIFQINKPSN